MGLESRIGLQLLGINFVLGRERRNIFTAAQKAQLPLHDETEIPPLRIGIVTSTTTIANPVTTETGLNFDIHTQTSPFGDQIVGLIISPDVFISHLPPEFQEEKAISLPFDQMVDQLEATALGMTFQAISFTFTGSTDKASQILQIYQQDRQNEKQQLACG